MNFSKSKWKKQDFGYSFGRYEIRKGESWKVYFMGDFVGESETLKYAKLIVQDHWDSRQPLESVEITGIVSAEIVGEKIHIQLKSCEIIIDKSRANREVKEWLDSPKCDCCGKLEVEIECPRYEEKMFKMLFGQLWCYNCKIQTKNSRMLKQKNCKILAKHNRNHKAFLAGNPPNGYENIACEIEKAT